MKKTLIGAGIVLGGFVLGQYGQSVKYRFKDKEVKKQMGIPNTVPTYSNENKVLLLKEFQPIQTILHKNDFNCWAICGTLLGMARFNDVMPWDDDIDIGIMKSDEETIIGTLKRELPHNNIHEERFCWKISEHVDIFTFESDPTGEDAKKIVYSNKKALKMWPKEWFYLEEVSNLNWGQLGTTYIKAPFDYTAYLRRSFGDDFMTHCYVKYPHRMNYLERALFWNNPFVQKEFYLKPENSEELI